MNCYVRRIVLDKEEEEEEEDDDDDEWKTERGKSFIEQSKLIKWWTNGTQTMRSVISR